MLPTDTHSSLSPPTPRLRLACRSGCRRTRKRRGRTAATTATEARVEGKREQASAAEGEALLLLSRERLTRDCLSCCRRRSCCCRCCLSVRESACECECSVCVPPVFFSPPPLLISASLSLSHTRETSAEPARTLERQGGRERACGCCCPTRAQQHRQSVSHSVANGRSFSQAVALRSSRQLLPHASPAVPQTE